MNEIYVVGVGMTPFGRHVDKSVKDLTRMAVTEALVDAGVSKAEIGAAFFANASQAALEGQYMIPGQIALRSMGFSKIPIINTENACASASTAFHLACHYIKSGAADIVLAVGAEKMVHPDREKSFQVFDGAWDVHETEKNLDMVMRLGRDIEAPDGKGNPPGRRSLFMDIYAAWAKQHMAKFGTTEKQIAAIAAKNHNHSQFNSRAQYQNPMSVEDVLNGRLISWPLTLPMCAPISDGAAAAVLCSESQLRRFGNAAPIRVLSTILVSGEDRDLEQLDRHVGRRAASLAYEAAGLGPQDISVAEVHDATAFAEVQQAENLGFCALGDGGALAESGATTIGGRIPINPSGGLECKGHPIGATGLGQIWELVEQLRGRAGKRQVEGARVGIAENGGGFFAGEDAATCITILGKP